MPRVKVNQNLEKQQKRFDNLRGLIEGEMARYHIDNDMLAAKALINSRTLRDKRREPDKITLPELFRIADVLKIKIILKREEGPDE